MYSIKLPIGARLTPLAGYSPWPALILSYGTVGSAWRLRVSCLKYSLSQLRRNNLPDLRYGLTKKVEKRNGLFKLRVQDPARQT